MAYRAPAKPTGSIIEEVDEWGEPRFRWRLPTGGPQRYFAAAFLAFWLCGWAVGWVTVTGILLSGAQEPPLVKLFLIAWLGGWTVGGGAAIWSLWTMVRAPRPESVTLGPDYLVYDPGTQPLHPGWQNGWNPWGGRDAGRWSCGRVKRPITVPKAELGKFVIDRVGERQRLSFDRGAERIEIGACLGEPEREWLQAVLEEWRSA